MEIIPHEKSSTRDRLNQALLVDMLCSPEGYHPVSSADLLLGSFERNLRSIDATLAA